MPEAMGVAKKERGPEVRADGIPGKERLEFSQTEESDARVDGEGERSRSRDGFPGGGGNP